MFDQLQGLPTSNLTGVFGTVLSTWLVWPVLCGLIGARRGIAMHAALQGLFWGPFALIYVLLATPKHLCPTCKKRTLKAPMAKALSQPEIPTSEVLSDPFAIDLGSPSGVERPVDARAMSREARERLIADACAGYDEHEAARLRAWVNGE